MSTRATTSQQGTDAGHTPTPPGTNVTLTPPAKPPIPAPLPVAPPPPPASPFIPDYVFITFYNIRKSTDYL